ncbi:MAG: hypothetical protein ABJ360_13505 [Roseobacter sp.]
MMEPASTAASVESGKKPSIAMICADQLDFFGDQIQGMIAADFDNVIPSTRHGFAPPPQASFFADGGL